MSLSRDSFQRVGVRCALIVTLVAALSLAPWQVGGLGANESASAATWAGTVQGKKVRASRFASAGATMRGDFFIRVDRRGRVNGSGVIAYDPFFNTDGLNAYLGFARGLVQSALGGFPIFGGFAATQLNAFVGVRVALPSLPVTRGPVTGRLDRGKMSLSFGRKPESIPFSAFINTVGPKKQKKLTAGNLVAPDPFGGPAADVSGGWAVSKREAKSTKEGVTTLESSYWTAHRVGG